MLQLTKVSQNVFWFSYILIRLLIFHYVHEQLTESLFSSLFFFLLKSMLSACFKFVKLGMSHLKNKSVGKFLF